MKQAFSILFILVLFLFSCKEDEPTAPSNEQPNSEVLAEASIGPEGGELKNDELIFTVPAGSFSSNTDIKLNIVAEDKPYYANTVSDLYKIDGIPNDFNKSLRIALKHNGSLTNESYVAIGEMSTVTSLGESITTYCLYDAYDSLGYLVANLSIPESNFSNSTTIDKSSDISSWIKIVGVTNILSRHSVDGHFKIHGEASITTQYQLDDVGTKCETAFKTFKDLKFTYDKRNEWPIPIFIKQIYDVPGYLTNGYYTGSFYLEDYGYIVLNTKILNNPEILSVVSAHEFFHLIQHLYDSRNWIVKKNDYGIQYWLMEATAVYSEELFAFFPDNYVSGSFDFNRFAPLQGFHKQVGEMKFKEVGHHGYGTASVINYLIDKFPSFTLSNLWNDISLGRHPIEAIIDNSNKTTTWVTPFFRDYIEGNIYNVQPSFWISSYSDEKYIFNINTKDDTLKVYEFSYHDFSAYIYKVILNYNEITKNSTIDFSLASTENEKSEISVYKYNNNNELFFLNNSTTQVIVPEIKELTSGGWNLLGLLTNTNAKHPYTGKTDITLNIKVNLEKPTVTGCLIQLGNIEADVIMDYTDGSTTTEDGWYSDTFFGHNDEPTSITIYENNEYSSSFDYTATTGIKYSGVANVKFNEEFTKIISFSVNREMQYEPNTPYGYVKQSSLSGHDIPIDPHNANNIWFKLKGSETCNKIDQMSYQWITTGYTETKEIKSCNEDSYIEILVGLK